MKTFLSGNFSEKVVTGGARGDGKIPLNNFPGSPKSSGRRCIHARYNLNFHNARFGFVIVILFQPVQISHVSPCLLFVIIVENV